MRHYVGMAGLHGCIPQFCMSFDSRTDAAESLADMHELSKNKMRQLRRDQYIELDIHKHGNEYAEIVECDCDEREVHDDN